MLRVLCISAARQRKFLFMEYNSTWRNIHPYTVKKVNDVEYLYGWCELHPGNIVERFIVDQIPAARVSVDDDYFIDTAPRVEEFDQVADE